MRKTYTNYLTTTGIIILLSSMIWFGYSYLQEEDQQHNPEVTIHSSEIDVELKELFPVGSFKLPTGLYFHSTLNNSAWLIELRGRVIKLNMTNGDNTTILDITSKIGQVTDEEGLVSLAFDPEFGTNGHIFLHYTTSSPLQTYISRFTLNTTSNMLENEMVVLKIDQPYPNHNGGGLAFGPDNYLYIGMGDGGFYYDPHNHGQNRTTLLGTILRIDPTPENSFNYSIPPDNPYVGNTQNFREEIYAYGMRNPYKMSFDPITGNLWVGDVGQDDREEVDIIKKGGNYGWKIYEGTYCLEPDLCDQIDQEEPIYEYSHDTGHAIIGGLVYRGENIPELQGHYIFADWLNGEIFNLNTENNTITLLKKVSFFTSSITQDTNQEVFLCGFDGSIYTIM